MTRMTCPACDGRGWVATDCASDAALADELRTAARAEGMRVTLLRFVRLSDAALLVDRSVRTIEGWADNGMQTRKLGPRRFVSFEDLAAYANARKGR